ncbi:glycoside hydrolase [Aspergillus affinis]|uniref:glycoside hydrolase n=1 Tax=Aspergillus affinis TaxID=1070780 RepID=UPI0022FE8835|nr:glycoside hydrolase [Aspergillus affinis]KAI9041496.1 glycoside hydrolase [Aspergillus affinis]
MAKASGSLFLFPLLLCYLVVCVYATIIPESNPLTFNLQVAADKDDPSCTKDSPCKIGCCGPLDKKTGKGVCGFGPDFCGKGCTSQCDRKSECDSGWGLQWSNASTCPLNVCCSKFGFCGTTEDFCQGKKVISPECKGESAKAKLIGYWEGWNQEKKCDHMPAEDIPLGYYTHLNFAFAYIDPLTYRVAPMDPATASRYRQVTALKARQPGLEVWIAIGGWAFNDPGNTATTFSNLAASEANQNIFAESLINFMVANGFDGVDLDWEYPVDDQRGGKREDYVNYVTFLKRLRERLNASGRRFGLSITLPASYWYLRGFDIANLEPHVDWFNIMTYDIHGIWDRESRGGVGSYAFAHTNMTEINLGLELLWRNNINPGRVVLGLGFYGRSFTMKDPKCLTTGCAFRDGGRKGKCTDTEGILSGKEINQLIKEGAKVSLDKEAAVKMVTWDNDQWVSWDDKETLKMKYDFANKRCLGGTMVWAVDLDDGTLIEALGQAMGKKRTKHFKPANQYFIKEIL